MHLLTKLTRNCWGALADKHFEHLTPLLRQNILEFYSDLNAPIRTKNNKKEWTETLANLEKLKAAQPAQEEPVRTGLVIEIIFDAAENQP